jgi:hypothetical protein
MTPMFRGLADQVGLIKLREKAIAGQFQGT